MIPTQYRNLWVVRRGISYLSPVLPFASLMTYTASWKTVRRQLPRWQLLMFPKWPWLMVPRWQLLMVPRWRSLIVPKWRHLVGHGTKLMESISLTLNRVTISFHDLCVSIRVLRAEINDQGDNVGDYLTAFRSAVLCLWSKHRYLSHVPLNPGKPLSVNGLCSDVWYLK